MMREDWIPMPPIPGPEGPWEFPFNGRIVLVCNKNEVLSSRVVYYYPMDGEIWTMEDIDAWYKADAFTHYAVIPEQPA